MRQWRWEIEYQSPERKAKTGWTDLIDEDGNYVGKVLNRVAELIVNAVNAHLDREPGHQLGCICADCSGAELTADND